MRRGQEHEEHNLERQQDMLVVGQSLAVRNIPFYSRVSEV